ncbi:hypothetical protein HZU67_08427 [Apis mellifera carnica]|nr:hypothetical protein HZU67_08427 [Apis mellifera carnica]
MSRRRDIETYLGSCSSRNCTRKKKKKKKKKKEEERRGGRRNEEKDGTEEVDANGAREDREDRRDGRRWFARNSKF